MPAVQWKEFKHYKEPERRTDPSYATATKLLAMCSLGSYTDK